MTNYNIPLAEQTLQYILDHPQQHDQGEWFRQDECGTVGCFFGWAAYLEANVNQRQKLIYLGADGYYYNGQFRWADTLAEELLGLDEDEVEIMYDGRNTIDDLQSMVKAIANGETLTEWATNRDTI